MIIIVQKGDPVLRKIAHDVPIEDIMSPKIKTIIKNMQKALREQEDGVAIAAPQVSEQFRIFVVSGKVLSKNFPDLEPDEVLAPDLVCINPVIVRLSKDKKKMPEGCLSIRWLYGNVRRATRAMIEAYDEQGNFFTRGGSGLLAQIFQHEIDHLMVYFLLTQQKI